MDFNFPSHLSETRSDSAKGWSLIKWAISQTNKYFVDSVLSISFPVILVICIFLPFWVHHIRSFGLDSQLVTFTEWLIMLSLQVLILFHLSMYLFNKTHPASQSLKMWSWTKEITWPWIVEGVKSSLIILLGFLLIIPGIIKSVHYTFFSFVVFFNRSFKEKKISSLKHSKHLSKGLRWWIFLTHIVYYALYFLIESSCKILLDSSHSDWVLMSILGVYTYLLVLPCIYLVTIWYFVYFFKDKEQMIGSNG